MTELSLIVRATSKIYLAAFLEALNGFKLNWWGMFLPFAHLLIVTVAASFLSLFLQGIALGFALGVLGTILLANYLAIVASASRVERVSLREIWPLTAELIIPLINVLFVLFVVRLLSGLLFKAMDSNWLAVMLNLAIFLLFNPIPEIIYQEGHDSVFGKALEFMKDNWIEWLLPLLIIFLPPALLSPAVAFSLLALTDLFAVPETVTQNLTYLLPYGAAGFLSITVLNAVAFLLMIFRGTLYKRLSVSTRRKRVYQEKMGIS